MSLRRRPALAAAAALALALAACESVTAGRPLAAEYALRDVGGKAPPIVLSSSATFDGRGTETITLIAAAYRFDAGGDARYVYTLRNLRTSPARDTTFTIEVPMVYWRAGDRIEIGSRTPCPPNALCAGNAVGRVVGDRVEVDFGGDPPVRYVYEAGAGARQPPP